MQIKIQVIATSTETKPTTKGSYQVLEVTYKDLDKNKVGSKKIMSFTKPESIFKTMATAKGGDVYDVELVKNEQSGYWDWTNVTKGSATTAEVAGQSKATGGTTSAPSAPAKGGWETPEERAKKQIYIVRQSSLSTAVNALTAAAKPGSIPSAKELINYARELEEFVFESDKAVAVAGKDVQKLDGFEDELDVPF
jgi:hypothetical protein